MPLRPFRPPACAPALAAAVVVLAFPGSIQAGESTPMTDAIQVLADLTLIDGACRDDAVNFGIAFRFAAEKGVHDVSIMPGGARRSEFEAALHSRGATFGKDELCGEIAANYAEALPGSVTQVPRSAQR